MFLTGILDSKEIKPEQLQISVASPFPGTEFYRWVDEHGYILTKDPNEYLDELGHQKAIISYPNLSSEELTKEVDKILKEYYLSLNYVPPAIRQIFNKRGLEEAKRLWYSARMFLKYIGNR